MSIPLLREQVIEVLDPSSSIPLKDKISILQTFDSTLKEPVTIEQSREILSIAPLGLFYYGFSVEDENLINVLCEIISKILGPFNYRDINSNENKSFLLEGLTHYNPQIRLLSIQQVNSETFMHVITTLSFQDTKPAQKASELLYKITLTHQDAIFSPTACSIIKQLLRVSETVKFRIYDLVIKVASSSNHAFELCESTGLLHEFISELQSNDLLVKMNAIELLNEIAATPSGIIFLERAKLVDDMSAILDNEDEDDVVVCLVKCSIIKFIGNLGENKDVPFQQLSNQYGILNRLETCLDSKNDQILTATISSIGLIGSHLLGLILVLPLSAKLCELYPSTVGSVKAVLLQTLSKLIGVRDEPVNESDRLTLQIFNEFDGFPNKIIREAKQPEDDIRIASLALMQSIAYHTWGVKYMAQSSVFMQYLLDRTTDRIQQGQMWKYTIIQTIVSHPNSKEILEVDDYNQCQTYIKQGPFYKPLETTVAFESIKAIHQFINKIKYQTEIKHSNRYLSQYGVLQKRSLAGTGASATVKVIQDHRRNVYAVKVFQKNINKDRLLKKKLMSEYCISSVLNHPNIVNTVDLVIDNKHRYCIVMEYVRLSYLHNLGVAHRDIKPENLLIQPTNRRHYQLKITDFGEADVFRELWQAEGRLSDGVCGSIPYMAPEVFSQMSYNASQADVWSAAIVYSYFIKHSIPRDDTLLLTF
ncbi:hypothetical protein G6F29_004036 [Rhizopus arrhizus]|nr:hypothetical protein G6F20_003611 [Rhizopus arrhizus]KAG0837329.1 hypothetical protein G6F19_003759 [Rhizopus arrhizus]KAG0899979.1 hypothetical protein G6F34_004251 [Rhizopus arrhizus]KAG0913270.1 hypothetical protein G6F33_005311 [Rhizopus arrhizus]KAG0946363.1 hypothetical protein G6F30_003797 [Rhizopus arrhizus]